VNAKVEVADGVVEEKFKVEMRDSGPPFVESALFAFAEQMGPVVKDENSAIGKPVGEVTKAIKRGFVNIAIDAGIAERFRASFWQRILLQVECAAAG
jgi:hypothetical protein